MRNAACVLFTVYQTVIIFYAGIMLVHGKGPFVIAFMVLCALGTYANFRMLIAGLKC